MDDPERHTIVKYEEELATLHAALLKMGSLVERQIAEAIESLVKADPAQARATIARDSEVNRMDVEIDEHCIRLIALYQPAADDLRLITTGLKITTDLERIGDNAVNICERTLELSQEPKVKPYDEIPQMATIAQSMLKDSLDAFTRRDVALAEAVIVRDDQVDDLDRQIHHELLHYMVEKPGSVPRATAMLFVSKFLERIADHATNIAEMVVFLVKGRLIRHMDVRRQVA